MPSALQTGDAIGPYRILAAIGAGGMGEVYRARDTRLNRDVAIKVLPEVFARDPETIARFQREAQMLAALSHPNIAIIHGLEVAGSLRAIVMEFVEGATIADRLQQGPIAAGEALPIARQIAEALSAAHDRGIIHRDLKPANVKITPDGVVKVLDFGLARAVEPEPPAADPALSPTLTAGRSQAGVILGTAGYMSPEQARASALDKRTDIWSFGVVLFEMLTGKPLFTGATISDTLAGVLRSDPEWSLLPADVPPRVQRMLRRCLDRDRKTRLRDMAVFLEPEEQAIERSAVARAKAPIVPWCIAALAAVCAVWLALRPAERTPPPVRRFSIAHNAPDAGSPVRGYEISPDGRSVAYVREGRIWVHDLDREDPRLIAGVQGVDDVFWSPDGRTLGFVAGAELKRMPTAGGQPAMICRLAKGFRGAVWKPDGKSIIYAEATTGLWEVAAEGGTPRNVVPATSGATLYNPVFADRSGQILVAGRGTTGVQQIVAISLRSGRVVDLPSGAFPAFANGHVLYQAAPREGGLMALSFSLRTLVAEGVPAVVAPEGGKPHVAADGTLIYMNIPAGLEQLVLRDRSGAVGARVGQPQVRMSYAVLSPGEDRIAVTAIEQGNQDVWIHDIKRNAKTRLTTRPDADFSPSWHPTGEMLSVRTIRGRFLHRADGSGEPKPIQRSAASGGLYGDSWSSDGNRFAYSLGDDKGDISIWYTEQQPDGAAGEPIVFLRTQFLERCPQISPDGRFLAYQSNESGRDEIYVRPFPAGDGKWQISTNGGAAPVWKGSGKEIFFLSPGGAINAVAVSIANGRLSPGAPHMLFRSMALNRSQAPFDVTKDGKLFVIPEPVDPDVKPPAIHIVQSWWEEFRARQK